MARLWLWRAWMRTHSWLHNQRRRLQRARARRAPRKIFISFADEEDFTTRYLVEDVRRLGVFDEVRGFAPQDLGDGFWARHGAFLRAQRKGYGYWIWKPWLMRRVLRELQEDDILVYADAGCAVTGNAAAKRAMLSMFERLQHSAFGIAARTMWHLDFTRACKGDAWRALGVRASELSAMRLYMSNKFICRKSPMALRVLEQCARLLDAQRYELFDDTPSRSPNLPQFREHRHDQAILSLLLSRHGCEHWHEADDMFYAARFTARNFASLLAGEPSPFWQRSDMAAEAIMRDQAMIRQWLLFRRAHHALPKAAARLLAVLPVVEKIPELGV